MSLIPRPWPPEPSEEHGVPPLPQAPDEAPVLWLVDRGNPRVRGRLEGLGALLAADERARLQAMRQVADQERFLLGRGVLRLLLGAVVGRDPAALAFHLGPHGKPHLVRTPAPRFNVAHSGDLVLLGFHRCREVGVDVEQRRAVPEWEGIARRCLPPGRHREILALPSEQRLDAFLTDWCLLEARLKARGLGMFGLEEPGRHPAAAAAPVQWRVRLPQGYLGAAALA